MAVTLNDIAAAAGVSRGTVDRALNNRGRINPDVEARIKRIAKEMGYAPNLGGRALAYARKHLAIGVILQFAETPFIEAVLQSVREAAHEVEEFGCLRGSNVPAMLSLMDELEGKGVNAFAIIASENEALRERINECAARGVRVLTFNSDLENSERICYIGQDSVQSGRAAAALMGDILGGRGKIALLNGTAANANQRGRERGFYEFIMKKHPGIEIAENCFSENNAETLATQAEEILLRTPDLAGFYVNSEGKDQLCRLLKEYRIDKKIKVIGHDMADLKVQYLQDRTVDYILDEDAQTQGREPVMTLFRLLFHNEKPEKEYLYTHIRILSAYNC